MTLGQAIRETRRKKGWTQKRLGAEVGLGQSTISSLENDEVGSKVDMGSLIGISEALDDPSILLHHCNNCSLRSYLFEKYFHLGRNDRQDLSIVSRQLRKEMGRACSTLDELIELLEKNSGQDVNDTEEIKRLAKKLKNFEDLIDILTYQMILNKLLQMQLGDKQ